MDQETNQESELKLKVMDLSYWRLVASLKY